MLPSARSTDPETSHAAADSLDEEAVRASQAAVLAVLETAQRPITDIELLDIYAAMANLGFLPRQSGSGIRTRRAELVKLGKVVDSGQRLMTDSGRHAIGWKVAR